jgi:hypothetical protein
VRHITNSDRFSRLKRASSRGGSFHGLRSQKEPLSNIEKAGLLKGAYFKSNDVVTMTEKIGQQL